VALTAGFRLSSALAQTNAPRRRNMTAQDESLGELTAITSPGTGPPANALSVRWVVEARQQEGISMDSLA